MRFQVLTVTSLKLTTFWDIIPCSLVKFTSVAEVHGAFMIRMIIQPSSWLSG
jgi:hypothetical protein